jgi:murein L,D-transpeptidase YcbB/YkuD
MSLKRAGVAIYPIAASKNPNVAALEKIASESSNEHVFLATSLPAIIQYVHQISQEACKGLYSTNIKEMFEAPLNVIAVEFKRAAF